MFGFFALIALMAAVTMLASHYLKTSQIRLNHVVEDALVRQQLVNRMHVASRERTLVLQRLLLHDDPFARDQEILAFDRYGTDFADARLAYLKMALSEKEKTLLSRQAEATKRSIPLQQQVLDLIADNRMPEARSVLMTQAIPAQYTVLSILDALRANQQQDMAEDAEENKRDEKRAQDWMTILSVATLFTSVLIAGFVIQRTLRGFREREQHIKEIADTRDRAETLLNNVQDGIVMLDRDGQIHAFNPAAERLFGYRASDVIGTAVRKLMPEISFDSLIHLLIDTQANHSGTLLRSQAHSRDGSEFTVEVSLSAVQQSHGALYVAVIRDISERLKSEEQVRAALLQKAEAEARDVAKSRFLATMSHELRTPLNAIHGYSELLAEDAELSGDDRALTDLRKIQGAANHLLGMISEILDLSKVEAGKMAVHQDTVSLTPLIQEIVGTITPLARKNNNQLTVDADLPRYDMVTDAGKLRQILLNLLANACKFTRDGEISFSARPETRMAIAGVTFEVRDTGIGISKEQLARLFMPFVQADGSHTRTYGGTGLGLAISKSFVEMLGGMVTVASTPGHGSTFSVWLPNEVRSPVSDTHATAIAS